MRLTAAVVADIVGPGAEVKDTTEIIARGMGIDSVDDLSAFGELRRLDLSNNNLNGSDLAESIGHNASITWISVAHNHITRLNFIARYRSLQVLNASHNEIVTLAGMSISHTVKAIVLNNNQIHAIEGFGKLPNLNTLILSHNQIDNIAGLRHLRHLKKVSLAHNKIRLIPVEIRANYILEELRLNDNKIANVPDTIVHNSKLGLVDLGNNRIKSLDDLENLRLLPNLINLNLRGNPVCQMRGYSDAVRGFCPTMRVFDGVNITPKGHPVAKKKRRVIAMERQGLKSSVKKERKRQRSEDARGTQVIGKEDKPKNEKPVHEEKVFKTKKRSKRRVLLSQPHLDSGVVSIREEHIKKQDVVAPMDDVEDLGWADPW